jgi:molybdate transport system substrate-binding protein
MPKILVRRLVLSVLLTVALALSGFGQKAGAAGPQESSGQKPTLLAYVGAQLKGPVQRLGEMYQKKTGVKVQMIFNNSGFLLAQLETSRRGDIYIPGSLPFAQKAQRKGIVTAVTKTLAYHVPVIVTPKGNPAGITGVRDLTKPGVKLLMPDSRATAIGADAMKTFNKLGITAQVKQNTVASLPTPAAALAAMLMGQGNAAVVSYNAIVKGKEKIHLVRIDPKVNVVGTVHCVVLSFSKHPSQAKDFAAFLTESGPQVFAEYGFPTKP